ncbi:sensor histidine kinase [Allostreptomyces psammosilenae]|uniref:Anti-sigma regulatory factor (Ser/Thr protein kinase) n=1 Tax=Allostreptomyces psammosilenae TaxID=1892865 RepID=A0A852ZTR3_9ACTN|nr:sensor histidine kinase [Allostreptomyces psammosilenae]NYI04164.1 anti-sigma regulatory factor (Ser/Thr protein kinase) [Allostreptomyces psammosilenae]
MTDVNLAAHGSGAHVGFRHEAFLYSGLAEFTAGTAAFVRDALRADEAVLVAVTAEKVARLRAELGADADRVVFVDMEEVGRNPGRIIPVWHEWVRERTAEGRAFRGVGEPIWAGRTPAEIVECQHHEWLLNTAFEDGPAWWLMCPYDTGALPGDVVEQARHRHRHLLRSGAHEVSDSYGRAGAAATLDGDVLPEPRTRPRELAFGPGDLAAVRAVVSARTAELALPPVRAQGFVLAVNEAAANSLEHGGGKGLLRMWSEDGALVCEVRDGGHIDRPLVGREPPVPASADGGRGVWLMNQVCDLVQIRSAAGTGTVVRLHVRHG